MLIRTRILLAYLIFIVILAVTAVSYFYFSNKQMKYYDITEKDVEAREIMKTASTIFAEQVRSYDYYVFLHEDTERFSFFEKKTLLADKMSAAEGLKVSGIGKLKKDIGEISGLFSTSFDMVKNSRREKAIEFSNAEILPRIDKISAVLHEMVEVQKKNFNYRVK